MNVSNIITQLQNRAQESNDPLVLATLAKVIEKLELGKIEVVNTVNDLPTLPLDLDGQLYLVEDDEQLYFNNGTVWRLLPTVSVDQNILYALGSGSTGRLGTNDTIGRSSPTPVTTEITNWSQVSAGKDHSLGLTDTGVLYAWGDGSWGMLGTDNTTDQSSPVTVVGGITNWSDIATGDDHSLGVTDTGIAYAWGFGTSGQLGIGVTPSQQDSPVTVVGGITNWSSVAAGADHSLGLTDTGVLYAWGDNNWGILGTNDGIERSSPVTVVGGITNWSQITASSPHSLALTDTGVLYAWGSGSSGNLGDGTTIDRSSPVTVVGGITNWSDIAGGFHPLGLTDTGVLYAWGDGNWGKLGTNDTIDRSSPVTVVGGITNWSDIAAGSRHSLGLTDTGVLYAWGDSDDGKLGTNDGIERSSPVTVVGGITNWSQVSAGEDHSLVISNVTKETLFP